MKSVLFFPVLCCVTLGGCASSGQGAAIPGIREATATLTTLQDKPLRLNFVTELNADCTARGEIIVQIIEPPSNGTTAVSRTRDYTNFNPLNQRAACNKEKRPGTELVYRPRQGFSGTDTLVADTISTGGSVLRVRYNIVVR